MHRLYVRGLVSILQLSQLIKGLAPGVRGMGGEVDPEASIPPGLQTRNCFSLKQGRHARWALVYHYRKRLGATHRDRVCKCLNAQRAQIDCVFLVREKKP